MKCLPYERYTIVTSLSIAEARQRLLDNLEPERNADYILKNKTRPYQGTMTEDEFTISRIIRYWNSFLPQITGRFYTDNGQTHIRIRMRPVNFVLVFVVFWLGVMGTMTIALPISALTETPHRPFSPFNFAPLCIFLFGYALIMTAFKLESSMSKKFLAELYGSGIL